VVSVSESADPCIASQPRVVNRWPLEERMARAALPALLFPAAIALGLLWFGDYSAKVRWTLTVLTIVSAFGGLVYLRDQYAYSLRSIAGLLVAIREHDFSIRLRPIAAAGVLNELADEANALRDMLHQQRIAAAEASGLLQKVLHEIDVVILAFDRRQRLRNINPRGEILLGANADELLGRTATSLGLTACLTGETPRVIEIGLSGGQRWELRRTRFLQDGEPLELIVLFDLTKALRHEQWEAWLRLVRVLRHEINNSLAPIGSLAVTMSQVVQQKPLPADWQVDLIDALQIIADRSGALTRMMQSYAHLTGQPPLVKTTTDVESLVRRVAAAEAFGKVIVAPGEKISVSVDKDQLDQVLINLVRNAVDASATTGGVTTIDWSRCTGINLSSRATEGKGRDMLEIGVDDEGTGLSNSENLFVPFFTTKPGGSGVGLALSRQIVEAHGGTLTLSNRAGGRGCRATLRLPLS
jgi:nitrogen fixation/metabolism regulation signal transduction histidine kinase